MDWESNNNELQCLINKLLSFKDFKKDWDSYGAEPINRSLIDDCIIALAKLNKIKSLPIDIRPTSDSEIIFEWQSGFWLHFYNDKSVVCLESSDLSLKITKEYKSFSKYLKALLGDIYNHMYK